MRRCTDLSLICRERHLLLFAQYFDENCFMKLWIGEIPELSPTVVWKAELLRDKLGYLGEQIFKC